MRASTVKLQMWPKSKKGRQNISFFLLKGAYSSDYWNRNNNINDAL